MRGVLFLFLFLLPYQSTAQERIPKTGSLSLGHVLTKGVQVQLHYHLNTFDEGRLQYVFNIRSLTSDSVAVPQELHLQQLSLDYAKGIRLRPNSFNSVGLYVGAGIMGTTKKISETTNPSRHIGIHFFGEMDVRLARKLSLYMQYGNAWMFSDSFNKNGAMTIGIRAYF